MKRYGAAGLALVVMLSQGVSQGVAAPVDTKGRIESVTVYRGQALVTRLVEAAGGAGGLAEVVVTDLPSRVLGGSLYAEGVGGSQIRSVQFRTRPAAQDVRAEVRELDAQILKLSDELAAANAAAQRLNDRRAYLEKMENFVAPTAQVELTRGVLNAETLTSLAQFAFKQREEIGVASLEAGRRVRDVQAQLDLKVREREKLTAGSARTVNEAVVFVSTQGGAANFRIRYLVDQATWSPSYNARAEDAGGLSLEYFASVTQMSGEDWAGVKLELSTATPALVANAPDLLPMTVALTRAEGQQQQQALGEGAYRELKEELSRKQRDLENRRSNERAAKVSGGQDDKDGDRGGSGDFALNVLAGQTQLLDLVATNVPAKRDEKVVAPASEEGLSVTYRIEGATTLPSRDDRQLIQIAAIPMKAQRSKLASPVLTQYVYDQATMVNDGSMVLLAGPVTAYSGGSFVGHGVLPTVATGQTFTLGLGIDSSLRSQKELASKAESVQGGNKVLELTYQLTIENFGNEAKKVRLADRLPKGSGDDVRVVLVRSSVEPVKDPAWKDKKDGLLAWDLEVPAQAVGGKAAVVEYTFRLEYDKQMQIVTDGVR